MSNGSFSDSPSVGDRPTLQASTAYGSYKPGEVRLYGRPAVGGRSQSSSKGEENSDNGTKGVVAQEDQKEREIVRLTVRTNRASERGRGRQITEDVLSIADNGAPEIASIGVIYGYAYEGHCYKLPKPQIMLLPVAPASIVDGDCGYKAELGYAVWQLDKLERAVALDVRTDDLKTLVLDANTPGNRSPLAYAQAQALAPHRSRD